MDAICDKEIKGKFSPLEVFSIGRAAQVEGYTELSSYIRDTMLRRAYEVTRKDPVSPKPEKAQQH